jgi:4-diphosphocytidyl-2-C-methyl-D-erythritol kinase
MKALYDVPAPAKLNLFLHITGRRADGYHLLQSAFMLIDWCDHLHFERRDDGKISREDLTMPLPPQDLVVRAALALRAATGTRPGVHIAVHKEIPTQAGMGGGSSDAASCLLALNRLWKLNLSIHALAQIGLTLGADVPFFLGGHNAWVQGIGEELTPLALPPSRFAVLKPPEGLDTARIFAAPQLQRQTESATISGFAANPYGFGRNDLQPVAQSLCPAVTQGLELLTAAGLAGRMTGSGSAVFAQMPNETAWDVLADLVQTRLPATWQVRQCGNLELHPLVGWAPSDD